MSEDSTLPERDSGAVRLVHPGERVGVAIFDDVHTAGEAKRFGRTESGATPANWHSTAEGGGEGGDREGTGYDRAKLEVLPDGSLYCTNFVVFPYLDDVEPGDGGLCGSQPSCPAPKPTDPLGVLRLQFSCLARTAAASIGRATSSTGPATRHPRRRAPSTSAPRLAATSS